MVIFDIYRVGRMIICFAPGEDTDRGGSISFGLGLGEVGSGDLCGVAYDKRETDRDTVKEK